MGEYQLALVPWWVLNYLWVAQCGLLHIWHLLKRTDPKTEMVSLRVSHCTKKLSPFSGPMGGPWQASNQPAVKLWSLKTQLTNQGWSSDGGMWDPLNVCFISVLCVSTSRKPGNLSINLSSISNLFLKFYKYFFLALNTVPFYVALWPNSLDT